MLVVLASLLACDAVPTGPQDIDLAIATGDFEFACKGLRVEDLELRAYTGSKLVESAAPAAAACTCSALYDAATGTVDLGVAGAAAPKGRDDLASCLVPAIEDARVDRVAAMEALAAFKAKPARDALVRVAEGASEPSLRAGAMSGLRRYDDANPTLIAGLQAKEPEVRLAAASALERHVDQGAILALDAVVTTDASAEVRAAAATSLASVQTLDGDFGACKALIGDTDPVVRAAPLRVWQTQLARRPEVVECLEKKLGTVETDAAIRGAVIAHLKLAGTEEARRTTCAAIGPYTRANVTDTVPEEGSGDDLISVQNALDWERTLSCVQKAYAQGGYTCHGRYWLAWWIVRTGGHAMAPSCPGMTSESIQSSGPREISF